MRMNDYFSEDVAIDLLINIKDAEDPVWEHSVVGRDLYLIIALSHICFATSHTAKCVFLSSKTFVF